MNNEQQTQATDDPSGDGWRDVEVGEVLRHTDMFRDSVGAWVFTENKGLSVREGWERTYRRRIEQQQASDSEPETMEQLREQVTTLTRERDRYRNQLAGAIEHSKAPEAQAQLVDRLQKWLRPVLEVVADHPDHSSILAASVLEFLPQIASRLIEE
jgi:hypothetical protein